MQSIYLLISISLGLFVVGIWAVYYAVKSHQFDDLDSAGQRIILDDRQERREQLAKNLSEPIAEKIVPPKKNSDITL